MAEREKTAEMAALYETGWSLAQIGGRYGITRQAVQDRFRRANVVRRAVTKYKDIDKKRLETLYLEEKISIERIADEFAVDWAVISRALEFHCIPVRPPLKLGGSRVDFLRTLAIGETKEMTLTVNKPYVLLHYSAKISGIKISMRTLGGGKFKVTRLT